ncbi:hypothetical protein [Nocardia fluminea]|nr:hypothetical protein [Nocardia fluminea]
MHGGLTRRVPGFDVYVTVAAGSVVGDAHREVGATRNPGRWC